MAHAPAGLILAAAGWLLLLCSASTTLSAQVLARPGWAGSGVAVEPWWHRAVFYRIEVDRFQDGTGAGCGNIAGVIQRLGYLQGLGVDALVLAPGPGQPASSPSAPSRSAVKKRASGRPDSHGLACGAAGAATPSGSMEGLDDLTRQASSHNLRVIVEMDAPASLGSDAVGRYVAQARAWLNQGAAGLYIPSRQLAALNTPDLAGYLVRPLR